MRDNAFALKVVPHGEIGEGIRVVGSREALRSLAEAIQAGVEDPQDPYLIGEPSKVVSTTTIVGPFAGKEGWILSFCIEGSTPAEKYQRLESRYPKIVIFCGVVLFASFVSKAIDWLVSAF